GRVRYGTRRMTVNTHRASADKPPPGKLGQEISISWGALRQGASCASISWRRKKGPDAAAAIVASAPRSKERALRPRIQIALHGAKSAPTRVRPPPMIPKRRSRNGLCVTRSGRATIEEEAVGWLRGRASDEGEATTGEASQVGGTAYRSARSR